MRGGEGGTDFVLLDGYASIYIVGDTILWVMYNDLFPINTHTGGLPTWKSTAWSHPASPYLSEPPRYP